MKDQDDSARLDELLERGSFGEPVATKLRRRTSDAAAEKILALAIDRDLLRRRRHKRSQRTGHKK